MLIALPAGPIFSLLERAFHIEIGQLHTFGMAGRARCVKLDEIILPLIIKLWMHRFATIAPRIKGGPLIMPAIHRNHPFDARAIGQNAFNKRHEILADKNHFRLRIV